MISVAETLEQERYERSRNMPSVLPTFIGVDPGASGGLAALTGSHVKFKSMPDTEQGILDWLRPFSGATAVIEWISPAMFGTDKSSMSKLYGSYKALRMALIASGITIAEDARPAKWMRAVGVDPRKRGEGRAEWKQRLKARAEELFPSLHITLATSDALLLAYYCRQTYGAEK